MTKKFENVYLSVVEKDEHKKSKTYKKLSPKMKNAVDQIFKIMDANKYYSSYYSDLLSLHFR